MYRRIVFISLLFISLHTVLYAQVDTLLNRYRQFLFQAEHPADVEELMHSLNAGGQWPDIDYNNADRASWQLMQHLQRTEAMAVAWANPASRWYHQDSLRRAINSALDHWLYHRYYNPNWWYNEIGVPQYMQNILILLWPALTAYQRTRGLEEMAQYRINGTGANLIWSAELGFHYGALTGDTTLMRHCIDTIIHEVKITSTGEGIQPDYSFHMHDYSFNLKGGRLQIYSYGKAYLGETVKLALETRNTSWAFPEDKLNLLADFVLKGWQWMCRGINTVPGTIDRSISRKNALHAADIRDLIPYLCRLYPDKAKAFLAIGDRQNGNGNALTGFRYFPYSDFAAYQCRRFSFFLKTLSTRTLPSESINGENLKGHLLNSGDAYLIHDGHEYFNLMPVWNWDALPGITTFTGADKMIRKPFTGSVSDSMSGLTAMDYEIIGRDTAQRVYAHKIWVCHDNLVVCLIAGLTAKNIQGNVCTVLDQSRWQGIVTENRPSNMLKQGNQVLPNASWICHNGFSYILLKPSEIRLGMDTVTGSWSSVCTSESDTLVADAVFMPVMLHGQQPAGLSAGYVLTYTGSAEQTAALAGYPVWKILRNDDTCQAVQFTDHAVMAAFFSPGVLPISQQVQVRVDRPCLMLLSPAAAGRPGKIYLSDPLHQGGMLKIQMNHTVKEIILPDDGTTTNGLKLPYRLF
jgi:chondroitin AC lyase